MTHFEAVELIDEREVTDEIYAELTCAVEFGGEFAKYAAEILAMVDRAAENFGDTRIKGRPTPDQLRCSFRSLARYSHKIPHLPDEARGHLHRL